MSGTKGAVDPQRPGGATGSGTPRKTQLMKLLVFGLLLSRLKEVIAREHFPGNSVKQRQDLALPKLKVAQNSGEGRLLLAGTQSQAVIGLP